ncbi:bifunctional [glutamate--ammonia ligase]-adenylyl-L-tyrosine phosphorylase/[glutamate--ammonia-ligase] adenylyltransferase [Solimonas sp. K1W22B-7]|nr:bifunctional [glutamate--ammonia ligase]-adenylyl-L-tyrosine phosphorylase/[glutamate--ammonia-ligase] adenylyltransferase [Solimonas sp. K1W22B-7]
MLALLRAQDPALAEAAATVCAASPFVAASLEWMLRHGSDLGELHRARAPGQTAASILDATRALSDEKDMQRVLRQRRREDMTRIAFRDLSGWAPLDEALDDLSDLADACCEAALRFAGRRLQARHGLPRNERGEECRPVVLGMGKLGGRELNFSSDIDLIFCYTQGGETDGARPLSNDEYFGRLTQDTGKLLSARTEDGFVFRVDTMLRPFGSAGALAASFAAMEEYYQVHGREWERYALIKARPVAGDIAAGEGLLRTLRPFVYRRYLDFNAIGSLRELKRLIEDDVKRKGMDDNVKLGRGGIRELEFIVQSFQLVRGGNETPLRDARLRPVLRYLGEAGHLPPATAARLDACYVYLRRLENAIQMYGDEQAHVLPADEARRAALCVAMGNADWCGLLEQLDEVRGFVQNEFERIFAESGKGREEGPLGRLVAGIWSGQVDAGDAADALYSAGYKQSPKELVEDLEALKALRLVRGMREETALKLQQLLAQLFGEALQQAQPALALRRALRIIQAVVGRSTYLTLLRESDATRQQLLGLCAASPWLTEFIAQSPVLLDSLLDPRTLYAPPEKQELFEDLALRATEIEGQGTEAAMDLLRRYQKEMTLRVAAADLLHALPLVKISDRLTWLAEAIVGQALRFAWAEMSAQYGEPLRRDGQPAGFGVIAYGKFGGIELGYGSDLDLVFVHDCDALEEDSSGGGRPLNNGTWLARLAQRLINSLATQTHAGRAYEIDMQLRPSGASGLLVSSLEGFAGYQRSEAWTWEHQALTRARYVAGSAGLGTAFEALRLEVLCRPRDAAKLRQEVADMRRKMVAKLDKSTAVLWDVKQGQGGLTDCEFLTQFLVLRDAAQSPAVAHWSDNWRQLEALAEAGSIGAGDKEALIDSYRAYRGFAHVRSLQNEPALVPQEEFLQQREVVKRIWKGLFGE